eukprot:1889272-Karenia_brevis.AAC.1
MACGRLGAGCISPTTDAEGLVHMRADEDFSATAHMLQGATLLAAIVDCLEAGHTSRLSDMLAAYVGLSRAKLKETVLITQPFSP